MKKFSIGFYKKTLIRMAIVLAFLIVGLVVSFSAKGEKYIEFKAEENHIRSVYDDTSYDYILTGISSEQFTTLDDDPSVEHVFWFSRTYDNLGVGIEDEIEVLTLKNEENLVYTEFSNKRIIKSKTGSPKEIYVGYDLVKKYRFKLGDYVKLGTINFEITRIYDYTKKAQVFVPGYNDLFDLTGVNDVSTSVYVVVKNDDAFRDKFLNPFIPEALIRSKGTGESVEDYNAYLDNFYSKDYTAYYEYKYRNYESDLQKIDSLTKETRVALLHFALILGAFLLSGLLVYSVLGYKVNKREKVDSGVRELNLREAIVTSSSALFTFVLIIISVLIIKSRATHFATLNHLLSGSLSSVFIILAFALLGLVLNLLVYNLEIKKKKAIKSNKSEK